jgi:serine/threonine protein kinase
MAPELLSNKQYSLKVDVYSFGVLLWEICARKTPYHNLPNQMDIVRHVLLQKGRPLM